MSNTQEITILIVDEQSEAAQAIARVVGAEGMNVQLANSLQQARELVAHFHPEVVVAGLGGPDGLQLLVELDAMDPGPDVIVHTEAGSSPVAQWAERHDIFEIFEKPAQPRVLLDWTYRLLRRRRGEPESVTMQRSQVGLGQIIGQASAISKIREQILRVAEFPLMSVLVCGETGTGKQLVARTIHELTSPDGPFVCLNCSVASEHRLERELFGIFNESEGYQPGLLEQARGGTFFLDEVSELPLSIQAKLLQVLESRQFRPLGAPGAQPLQARIIAATDHALSQGQESFRRDLYYRLAGFALDTPPLRERGDDVLLLARNFLRDFCRTHGRPLTRLTDAAQALLQRYSWPGNVRQLRAVVESAAVSCQGVAIDACDVQAAMAAGNVHITTFPHAAGAEFRAEGVLNDPAIANRGQHGTESTSELPAVGRTEDGGLADNAPLSEAPSSGTALVGKRGMFSSLPHLEQYVISDVFRECEGNLSMAARTLGIPRSTLRDRLKKYGIAMPQTQKK